MLFHGPPGVGKTMLAERVPGLLPELDVHDALEVSAVHSLAGFNLADELITRPPYSDPHHSQQLAASSAAANEWQSRARFLVPTKVCCSLMTPQNPNPPIMPTTG
jgi:Magnesium chelatase, subunit ChlI